VYSIVLRTSRTVVQLAFPGGVPAREKVRFCGEVTADHDRVASALYPRIGHVRQVSTTER